MCPCVIFRDNALNPRYKAKVEEGLSRFLAFLVQEEVRGSGMRTQHAMCAAKECDATVTHL